MNDLIHPITTPEDLAPLIEGISSAEEICLDTEADSLHHYFEKICLIQFTIPHKDPLKESHFLVDPLAKLDLNSLFGILKDKSLVFHGADYDLRMLRAHYDFVPSSIFDTMLAARLLGQTLLGLDGLVERYAGKHLDHGAQKADWSQRPLPPRLLSYAVDDTRYLPLIVQNLRQELSSLGRIEWHYQQCQQLIAASAISRTREPDEIWRIKGSSNLERGSLAVLREVWRWRDEEARQWDRPPYMVCGNEKLIELALWAHQNPNGNLRHGPVLPKRWPPRRFQTLHAAIKKAWDLSATEWPMPPARGRRPPYNPQFAPRLNQLRIARDAIAKNLQLDSSILASNAMLETITARNPKQIEDFNDIEKWLPWQTDLLGISFLKVLAELNGESSGSPIAPSEVSHGT